MHMKSEEVMYEGILEYAHEYKKREGKTDEQIELEMNEFKKTPMKTLTELQKLIENVRENVDMVYAPTFVVQARNDKMINTESANIIYGKIESIIKEIKWYEESSHVITLDNERGQLHEDVYAFLEKLDWHN
jgi:carboxylesterase